MVDPPASSRIDLLLVNALLINTGGLSHLALDGPLDGHSLAIPHRAIFTP
jgi:hypothetical protein